jgi:NADH-quinone oxidoreductase subunit L
MRIRLKILQNNMYIPLVFLSLIGFSVTGLFGRHIGPKGSAIITTGCLIISFFYLFLLFMKLV